MNLEIKEQWLTALRSGEYRQVGGRLTGIDNKSFCCLGVLCDLAVKADIILPPTLDEFDNHVFGTYMGKGDDYSWSSLPNAVQVWADLAHIGPDPYIHSENASLAELNDSGRDFSEIADIIESEL
jgi:hypothetical protein